MLIQSVLWLGRQRYSTIIENAGLNGCFSSMVDDDCFSSFRFQQTSCFVQNSFPQLSLSIRVPRCALRCSLLDMRRCWYSRSNHDMRTPWKTCALTRSGQPSTAYVARPLTRSCQSHAARNSMRVGSWCMFNLFFLIRASALIRSSRSCNLVLRSSVWFSCLKASKSFWSRKYSTWRSPSSAICLVGAWLCGGGTWWCLSSA